MLINLTLNVTHTLGTTGRIGTILNIHNERLSIYVHFMYIKSLKQSSQCLIYKGNGMVRKVHFLNLGCGQDVLHQVLVDPSVSLKPLAADANNLWPLQKTHLQLERHRHLPKVAPGLTFQGVAESRGKGKTSRGIRI